MSRINTGELYHHGIKGQKWGIRRYQNPDGTLTEEGKKRYSEYKKKEITKLANRMALLERGYDEISKTNLDESLMTRFQNMYTERAKDIHKELQYVSKMSFDDMIAEEKFAKRKEVGFAFANAFSKLTLNEMVYTKGDYMIPVSKRRIKKYNETMR